MFMVTGFHSITITLSWVFDCLRGFLPCQHQLSSSLVCGCQNLDYSEYPDELVKGLLLQSLNSILLPTCEVLCKWVATCRLFKNYHFTLEFSHRVCFVILICLSTYDTYFIIMLSFGTCIMSNLYCRNGRHIEKGCYRICRTRFFWILHVLSLLVSCKDGLNFLILKLSDEFLKIYQFQDGHSRMIITLFLALIVSHSQSMYLFIFIPTSRIVFCLLSIIESTSVDQLHSACFCCPFAIVCANRPVIWLLWLYFAGSSDLYYPTLALV